nr:Ig-like domain-containing protein [Microbacterium bovistercoris]
MRRRSLIATIVAVAAVAASIVTISIVWPGLDARSTPPENSSVWALQTGDGRRYARVNTAIGELDTVRSVSNPSAVAQTGQDAFLFSESYGKLTRIDAALPADLDDATLRESPSTPAGTVEVAVSGDFVAYRTDAGAVYAGTLSGGDAVLVDPNPAKTPDGDQAAQGETPFSARAIAVDGAGVVFAYSKAARMVVRYRITDGAVLGRDPVDGPAADAAVGLTAVDGTWFLIAPDSGTVWRRGDTATHKITLVGDVAYGRAQATGDAAWLADDTGLVRLPADGSAPERVVGGSTRDLGTPARPVVDDGVVFAAWLGADGGTAWNSDAGQSDLDYADKSLADERRPVFTGTGAGLIINDTRSGWVWNAHTSALLPSSQDWSLDDRTAPETAPSDERAQVVIDPKPPVAEPDAFGVRAGSLATLPVLLNDHDPNEDVLSIDPSSVSGLDPGFGALSLTDNGQRLAVHVAADAAGTATFRYRVTDGTAADGLYSAPVTVTLTVSPDSANAAPKWCGVSGCLAAWPSPQVAPGGTVTIPVLNGWVDPDGDPLMLLSATDQSGAGAVGVTPAGDVVYQHSDASERDPQIAQLKVVIGDVRGATTSRTLTVRISPKPKLSAESFTLIETQGSGLTVDVGDHVSGTQGRLSLTSVRVLDEAAAEAVAGSGGTTFDFSAGKPGVYRVAYTVTDGISEASATARVTVLPEDAPAQLATAPVVAFVHPQQDVTLDVFTAVSNPTRRVLLLSDVQPSAASGATMSVDVVGQNYLRVSGSTADGSPGRLGTIRYTVSDGTNDAGSQISGEATVYLLPSPSDLAPIAVDDAVVVRAGAQVDIPVLDNDVAAAGGTIILNPASVQSSARGALAFASGRKLRYLAPSAPGDYRIEYSVYTAGSPSLADTAVVRVKVIADQSNRAPRPRTLEGRVLTGQTTSIPFRSFGVDPDGDDVTLDRIVTQPRSGSATISPDGESIVYASVPGFHGQVSFTFRVADAFGATGVATVRVGVLDEQANPSPVTFTDYVQLQVGADNSVRINPLANDVDPSGGTLKLTDIRPDAVQTLLDGSENPEFARLQRMITATTDAQVQISAGTAPGTVSFLYDVTSSTGNTGRGLIVVRIVRDAVPDYPVVTDTVLTAATRESFPSGVDVVTGNVSWTGGDVADLKLDLWGTVPGVHVRGNRIFGDVPERSRIIPFSLTGTTAAGDEVTSYGFLRIPGLNDLSLTLKPDVSAQRVTESDSVTWDMADLVSMPTGATLEVGPDLSVSTSRKEAACTRESGTKVRYDAGAGAPWRDACVVPVRLAGQKDWTFLSVPITVTALDPVPELASASITVSPGATTTYDLRTMTTWQGRTDWDHIVYRASYTGSDFTVVQDGSTLTVTGADDASTGSEEVAVIDVTSHPGVAPARLILRVGAIPSTLPRAGTVTTTCSQADGSSCTVDVIGASGEVNPLPGTPLVLTDVRDAGTCTGVTFAVQDAAHVRAAWGKDAPGQTCTASFSVRDAQGRKTAGDRDGQVLLDLQGFPKAPTALVQSGYDSGQVTLRVDAGPARLAYPALTGFVIRYQGQVVTRCTPDGTCPVISAPNGEQRTYTANAVNRVGESSGSASTVAWAYDAPATPTGLSAAPVPTSSGDGGVVSVRVDGLDPSQTAGVRLSSEAGETVDVPLPPGQTSLTVPTYRIATNSASRLTATPYSRFSLPPGFDGSTTGQAISTTANGVGAPKDATLTVKSQSVNSDGTATIVMQGSATRNGSGSTLRLGIAEAGSACRVTDIGTAASIEETFTARVGDSPTYRLCAESWFDGQSFGRTETTQQVVVKPTNGVPTPQGYTFTVAAKPDLASGRAEWKIETKPTSSTDQKPAWADVEMSGYPTSIFDRDPGIQVWYRWGPFDGDKVAVGPSSGSAPYQVWADWNVEKCAGGETFVVGHSSVNSQKVGARISAAPSQVEYQDADGNVLDSPSDGTVPIGAVSVSGRATLDWSPTGWDLDAPAQPMRFSGTCTPNNPPPADPTDPPADNGN